MRVQLVTAPVLEPITSAELKLHLKTDSQTFAGNVDLYACIAAGSHAVVADYTLLGTGIEVLGKQAIVFLQPINNGTNGTVDVKIQECDTLAGTYTDWTGGVFDQVTELNDTTIQEKEYTGVKRYIRTAAKTLGAACEFGTSILINAATTAEDSLLTNLITTTREHVEDITRRQILTATWDYYLDEFPKDNFIELPFGNLQNDSAATPSTAPVITYKDTDGDSTTMVVSTEYLVETNGDQCGRIVLPYGKSWPSTTLYPSNPIKIEFVCGWTTAALVPYTIKQAVLRIAAKLYESRGEDIVGQLIHEDEFYDRLLASERLWGNFK